MLNDYLIKSYFNDQVEMNHELKRMCHLFSRDVNYVKNLKIIYREMIENGLTFLESCEKHTIHIYKTDMRGLSKNWRAHKNKKLYISKNF